MVLLQMNPQTGRQQRENFTKPKWKNYDSTMFWSRITTSHGIAINWYLRVYWLLPLSIVDSFAEHRRFFCWESTILLLSTDDSFVEHHEYLDQSINFISQRSLFLISTDSFFSSSTQIIDSLAEVILNQQTPANKTSLFLLTQRSYPTCWTLVIGWAVQRYVLELLENR